MKRDMNAMIIKAKETIKEKEDINVDELQELYERFQERRKTECEGAALLDLMTSAFYFGFSTHTHQ